MLKTKAIIKSYHKRTGDGGCGGGDLSAKLSHFEHKLSCHQTKKDSVNLN